MKGVILAACVAMVVLGNEAGADSVVLRSNGQDSSVAENVLITGAQKDKNGDTLSVGFFYWNSRRGMLVQDGCKTENPRERRIVLVSSSAAERKRLVSSFKGASAVITDVRGRSTEYRCLQVDYREPRGVMVIGDGPPDDGRNLRFESGGRVLSIPFSDVASVEFETGDEAVVVKKDKKQMHGRWRGAPVGKKNWEIRLYGVSEDGGMLSIYLSDVVRIVFR